MTDTSLSIRLDTTQIRAGIADLNSLDQSSLRTQQSINRMGDVTASASQRMVSGMSDVSRSLQSLATFAATAFAGGIIGSQAQQVVMLADKMTLLDSRIKIATSSIVDYTAANKALVDISLQTRSSLEGNVQLFARMNKSIEQMGGTAANTTSLTKTLAEALKVSGASAGEANSVMIQLSQALSSGVLRGDEFNSVMENGSRIVDALTAATGKNRGELRAMASDGKLTAEVVVSAMQSQAQAIDNDFKKIPLTVGAALENVRTQFAVYIKSQNEASSSTSILAEAINSAGKNMAGAIDLVTLAGEGLFAFYASKLIPTIAAYVASQYTAIQVSAAHSAAITFDLQRTVAITTARAAQTAAELANAEATLLNVQATTSGFAGMTARYAATQSVTAATAANTAATTAMTAAQAANTAATVTFAGSLKALLTVQGAVNAALAVFMGYQIGSFIGEWANGFQAVRGTAIEFFAVIDRGVANFALNSAKIKTFFGGTAQDLAAAKEAYFKELDDIDARVAASQGYVKNGNKAVAPADDTTQKAFNASQKQFDGGASKNKIDYVQITKDKKSEIDQQIKDIKSASDQKIAIIRQEKEKIDAIYATDKSDPKAYTTKINALAEKEASTVEASLKAQNKLIDQGIADLSKNAPIINVKVNTKNITQDIIDAVNVASEKYKISPAIIKGMISQESNFNPNATNNQSSAKGLMQLVDGTSKAMGYSPQDMFDVAKNIDAGTKYLSQQLKLSGGDMKTAIAAYYAGWGNIQKNNSVAKTGLNEYAPSVLNKAKVLGGDTVDDKAHLETQKAINELTQQRTENENKLALATGKTTVEQIKNNAELKKTIDSYRSDPTEIYRLAIEDLNKKQASGLVTGANYIAAQDKINETYYRASEAVSKAGSAMDKYTEAQAKANTYLDNTGDMQGFVNLINKADEAFQKTDATAIAYNETLEKQAKAKAELAGLEQTLSNTSYLVEMAKKLQIEGKTTEEIKKQIDLQQQLDRLKAKNPLIDESKAKSIISQNEEKVSQLKALTGGAAKETETAFKRAQENIQDGFATMFENMLNGDALASFDSFISNITKAFNKAIAQDFSTALGSLFKKGATDWGGIFSGVLMSGVSMLGSWLSGSDKAKPTTAMTTTNKNILGQAQMSIADTAGRNINEVASLPALQQLNSAIDVAGTAIRENAGKIWDFSSKYLSKMTSYLFGDAAAAAITKVTSSVSSMYNTVVGWGNKLIGGVKEIVGQAGSFISGTVLGGAAGSAAASGVNGVNGAAGNAAGNAAANAGSNTVSYIGIGLSIVKLGYDLFTIAGNKFMTTTDKVVAGLSSAGDAAFGIGISLAATGVGMPAAIVAFAVAAGAKVISAVTDVIANGFNLENSITLGMTAIGTMILPGIGTIIGAMLGSIFGSFLAKPPSATVLSYSIPDSNARKVSDANGDYHVSSGGKSGTVGVTTAFGEVDMRLNNISKNSGLMIEEATKAFLPLLRTIQAFDGALANSIRVVDSAYGQDSFKDFKIKAEHTQKLSKLDTSGFVSDRLTDIGASLAATGTKAGDTFNTWWSAFSAKLLKPNGKENSSYNTATSFNIEAFIASELPKLAELPKSLATLFVKSVKSVADGATQKEFEGQMNDFFMGWQIAKGGLKEIGIQIQDTALPEYLTSLVGIGMTVKESASTLVAFAATFDTAAGDVTAQFNTAFKGIFDNAKKNAYNNDQTVGYVGSYISLSNAAKQTGLSVTPDELNTLSVSLNTAASSAIQTANGVIDQAIATANLGNISRDAAIQQLALSGALTSEQIAAGSFSKALVEQQKIMLGGIDFAQQQAVFFGTKLSNMGLTFNDVANIGFNVTNTFKDLAEAMSFVDSIAKNVFSPTEYAGGKKAQAQATFDTSSKALGFKDYGTSNFESFFRDNGATGYVAQLNKAMSSGDTARATALRNLGASYNVLTEAETTYTNAVSSSSSAFNAAGTSADDAASKMQALADAQADVNKQIANSKLSDFGVSLAGINDKIEGLIKTASDNGGALTGLDELKKIDIRNLTKPLADELLAIGQSDYSQGLSKITAWAADMPQYAATIADAWGVSESDVMGMIDRIKTSRLEALDKEHKAALKAHAVTAARLDNTDFANNLYGIRDQYISSIESLAAGGRSYEELLSVAAVGARVAGKELSKAQAEIAKSFKDIYTAIADKRAAISDKIAVANGANADDVAKQRALTNLQSTDYDRQMSAIDTLMGLNDSRYQKEIDNAKHLTDYISSLKLDSNQTALNPQQQLQEATRQAIENLRGAQSGDQAAFDKLTPSFTTLLEKQKAVATSKTDYDRTFYKGLAELEKLAGKKTSAELAQDAQIQQVKELQSLQNKLDEIEGKRRAAEQQANGELIGAFNQVGADFVDTLQGFADAAGLEKNVSFDLSELIITDKSKASLEAFKASVITALDSGVLSDADAAMFKASSIGLVENVAGMIVKGQLQPTDVDIIFISSKSVIDNMGKLIGAGQVTPAEANIVYQSSIGVFNHLRELVDLQLVSGEVATQVYKAQTGLIDTLTGFIIDGKITKADASALSGSQTDLLNALMSAYKSGTISQTATKGIYDAQSGLVTSLLIAIGNGTIKGQDISLISGAVTYFSNTVAGALATIKLSPSDSSLYTNAVTLMSGTIAGAIGSQNFTNEQRGILISGLAGYASNPAAVLGALNFSQGNLDTLNSALTAAAGNPAEVFRLLGFSQADQDRLKAGLGDLSTNTGGALGAVTPGTEALSTINKGVDTLAKNMGDGLSAVDWLQAPGDIVRGGVNALATNIGGGLGSVSIDNSGINSAISGLMASIASQIAVSQTTTTGSIIANAQASVSNPVSAFNAAINSNNYDAAAQIAVDNNYSREQVINQVVSLGGSAINTAAWLDQHSNYKLFAKGGITNEPAIFGDAGAEAAVPLPDGRSIPVTLSGNRDNKAIAELTKELKLLKDQQKRSDDENKQLQIKIAMYLKKIAEITERADIIGTPPVRT